jgi:hypothetical protein
MGREVGQGQRGVVTTIGGTQAVWVFLIERGLDQGDDLALFWHEAEAIEAARAYLAPHWPPGELATADDVIDAIEAANQLVGDEEYIVLAAFPVAGNQYFEGSVDTRQRCRTCREPIELDDPEDPESWVHCIDAHDGCDHTAEAPSR